MLENSKRMCPSIVALPPHIHTFIHINKHTHIPSKTLTLPQTDIRIPSKSDFFINKYILRRQRGAPTHSRAGEQVSEWTHVCESASIWLRSQCLHSLSPLSIAALSHRFTLLRSHTPPRQGIVCDRAKNIQIKWFIFLLFRVPIPDDKSIHIDISLLFNCKLLNMVIAINVCASVLVSTSAYATIPDVYKANTDSK